MYKLNIVKACCIIVMITLCVAAYTNNNVYAASTEECSSWSELEDEIESLSSGDSITIKITKTISAKDKISIPEGAKVTIKPSGANRTIKRTDATGHLFYVNKEATLKFESSGDYSLTINGNSSDSKQGSSLVYNAGTLYLGTKDNPNIILKDNKSKQFGSALYNDKTGVAKLYGKIKNCESSYSGGGVENFGDFYMYDGSAITDCVSTYDGGGGGGICNSRSNIWLYGGTISGCKASHGGGISSSGVDYIEDVVICDNEAYDNRGGGIFISVGKGTEIAGSTKIYNNKAALGGGGIVIKDDASATISGRAMIYNNYSKEGGAGIEVKDTSVLNISSNAKIGFSSYTSITEYVASPNQGVAIQNAGTIEISDELRVYSGEYIAISNSDKLTFKKNAGAILIADCAKKIINNSGKLLAESYDETYSCSLYGAADVGLYNTTDGVARWYGRINGGYPVTTESIGTYEDCIMNITTGITNYGTGKYSDDYPQALTFGGNGIIKNCSTGIAVKTGTVKMTSGTVQLGVDSGVKVSEDANFILSNGTITAFSSAVSGPGINNAGTCNITGGTITDNWTEESGGGIYNKGTLTLTGGTITANVSDGNGGGIYNKGTLTLTGGTIKDNITKGNGGGINNAGTLMLTGGTITGNSSEGDGGGINNADTCSISAGTIKDNSTDDNGGGIYNKDTLTLTGGSITGNKAVNNGAGIYQSSNGGFEMGAGATVNTDNVIYLAKEKYISIVSKLTSSCAGKISTGSKDRAWGRVIAVTTYSKKEGATNDHIDKFVMAYETIDDKPVILRSGNGTNSEIGNIILSTRYSISYKGNLPGVKVSVPKEQLKYWNEPVLLSLTKPTISNNAYVFCHWNSKSDGSGETYIDKNYNKNSDLVLYAQWDCNINIIYNSNDILSNVTFSDKCISGPMEIYLFKQNTFGTPKDGKYIAEAYSEKYGTVMCNSFQGWCSDKYASRNAAHLIKIYEPGDQITIDELLSRFETSVTSTGTDVSVYAIWDEYPYIEANNIYLSAEEVKNGIVTEDFLIKNAKAFDKEDTDEFINNRSNFKVLDYNMNEWLQFESSGIASVTYQATDSAGNVSQRTINVYIVDTTPIISISTQNVRFISKKYFDQTQENGGLADVSIWNMDSNYNNTLNYAMMNTKHNIEIKSIDIFGVSHQIEVEGSGIWAHMNQSWTFSPEQVLQVKQYISSHGMGNVKEPNALAGFLVEFSECRKC